jgi:hypothetical protein
LETILVADVRQELHKAHRDGQEKYIYFLLAAAGAAIAFSITQTQAATITFSKMPLGIAVSCWGLSFYCGCKQILQTSNILQQNYQMLRVQSGLHPDFPNHPEVIAMIEKSLEEQSNASGRYGRNQFVLLLSGAVFYIVWHIVEMYQRTIASPFIV